MELLRELPLSFNNTRAKYDDDRNVRSASMNVCYGPARRCRRRRRLRQSTSSPSVGLVDAYFTPSDDIKILVVEIDGVMHNLTWKGL